MLRALYNAASGMQSQQLNLDVISNNLANVNTVGFKRTLLQVQAQPTTQLFRFQTDPANASGGAPGTDATLASSAPRAHQMDYNRTIEGTGAFPTGRA